MFYFHENDVTSEELSLCQRIGDAHALLITLRESSSEVISMKLEFQTVMLTLKRFKN